MQDTADEFPDASTDSVRSILRSLRRRWWVIVACLIVVPLAAYAYARTQPNQYTATANLLVNGSSDIGASAAGSVSAAKATSDLNTQVGIASLGIVSDRTAQALGPAYAGHGLPGSVAVNNPGSSNLITVTATERTPALAALVANRYANQVVNFSTASNIDRIHKEQADLRAQLRRVTRPLSAQAISLRSSINQLTAVAALQNAGLQIVAPATAPGSSSSPGTKQIVLIGIVLGLLLGVLFALVFAALDRRLRDPDQVKAALQGPILGAIPRSRGLRRAWGKDGYGPAGTVLEAFSTVYTNLSSYAHDQPVRSVLVTSANGREGKSTVAWNLALTGARAGARVLLIEADMRHPTLAARIGADVDTGLSDVLNRRDGSLADAIMSVRLWGLSALMDSAQPGDGSSGLDPARSSQDRPGEARLGAPATSAGRQVGERGFWFSDSVGAVHEGDEPSRSPAQTGTTAVGAGVGNAQGEASNGTDHQSGLGVMRRNGRSHGDETEHATLDVLFAGQLIRRKGGGQMRPSALLASKPMQELIRAAESEYDLVVIDSPPPSAVPDAIPLVKQVSGVLVVSRVTKSTHESARHLRTQLENLRARTIGVVINGVEASDGYNSSTYEYLDK